MPLHPKLTVSRVTKSTSRRNASPFAAAKRKKPTSITQRTANKAASGNHDAALIDLGLEDPTVLRARLVPQLESNAVQAVLQHVPQTMWADIPQKAPGMNGARISEILNYRLRLPPVVSMSHLHAIRNLPTATEREVAALIRSGHLRKVAVPGRGTGSAALGQGLVLVSEWAKLVRANKNLDNDLQEKYILHLQGDSTAPLSAPEIQQLAQQGYLTASSMMPSSSDTFLKPGTSSMGSLRYVANSGSKSAAGTDGAVASSAVQHVIGGSKAFDRLRGLSGSTFLSTYEFTLPNLGPYLRLITEARDHLLHLIIKSGPHKSMPLDRLKELWEGGAANRDSEVAHERQGILPGRTKKWRNFHGLRFEFVLAECLGAGLVECFRTGSIGTGIRAL